MNARGVLHSAVNLSPFRHERWPAPPVLEPYVEHFWMVSWDLRGGEPFTQHTIPHPCVHIVFEPSGCAAYGVHRSRFTRVLEGKNRAFGVKFRAGAFRPFVGWPVSRIANSSIAIRELFGDEGQAWAEEVLNSSTPHEPATAFLEGRLPAPDPTASLVTAIAAYIRDHAVLRIDEITKEFCLSERSLQRVCLDYAGVSAKWMIRVYRLHEVVAQLQQPRNLAALAQDLGYFDQAHFAKDFKAITGYTPSAYNALALEVRRHEQR